MSIRLTAAAAIAALAIGAPALAHHGWGGYDAEKVLNLTGTIEESAYENPHGIMRLKAADKVWMVVLAPPFRMENRGLAREALARGKTVAVVGYPHKTDTSEMRAERITVDGKTTELR